MLQRPGSAVLGMFLIVAAAAVPCWAVLGPPVSPSGAPLRSAVLTEPSDSTRLGVVWTPAATPDSAVAELGRIADVGATAVRLTRLPSDAVAARADSLGLRLYVDLPVAYVAAAQLSDALAEAEPSVERLRKLARRYPAITHVGLARGADTTVPSVCETLRRWTDRLKEGAGALRTYYVTPFAPAADRCADAVHRPLLDLRGDPAPVERWREWELGEPDVGLGAVGTWVQPTTGEGLRVPHSSERQARYLETVLSKLLDSTRTSPSAVFVSRWQDRSSSRLASRRYGLHDVTGAPRPAARVVRGLYTGTQRAFAFPAGTEPPPGSYGLVLVGWGLIALLGGLYAQNVFVRQTVGRYFTAPGFYRDALRDGHDLHPGANGLLLVIVGTTLGVVGTHAARMAAAEPVTTHVLAALPSDLQSTLAWGIEYPLAMGGTIGGLALGLLLLWMGGLVGAARWQTRFSVLQGLVLVVWPCWPALVALPIALAAGPEAPVSPSWFAVFVIVGGGLALVSMTLRVLYDYWAATDLSGPAVCLLGLLSPLALVSATVGVLVEQYEVPVRLLWHLVTNT